jgi:hypothetical protein
VCFFVQVLPLVQRAARQGLRGILCEPEIVQECADLCGDFQQEKTQSEVQYWSKQES